MHDKRRQKEETNTVDKTISQSELKLYTSRTVTILLAIRPEYVTNLSHAFPE